MIIRYGFSPQDTESPNCSLRASYRPRFNQNLKPGQLRKKSISPHRAEREKQNETTSERTELWNATQSMGRILGPPHNPNSKDGNTRPKFERQEDKRERRGEMWKWERKKQGAKEKEKQRRKREGGGERRGHLQGEAGAAQEQSKAGAGEGRAADEDGRGRPGGEGRESGR